MRAGVVKRQRVVARPIPVEQSIHWRPLRDAHYVVASLQPADGGRRKIVVRQQVLARIEALARAGHGRRVTGLLLGRFYMCSVTGVPFEVIESLAEHPRSVTDDGLAAAIEHALATAARGRGAHVLGWYCSAPAVETQLSGTMATIHTSHFPEPWQTTLVMADAAGAPGGAFVLYDKAEQRWFYAPFYELPDHAPKSQRARPTCISWPQYLTADNVVLVRGDQTSAPQAGAHGSPTASPDDRSMAASLWRISKNRVFGTPTADPSPTPAPQVVSNGSAVAGSMDRAFDKARSMTPQARPETPTDQIREIPVERMADRISRPHPNRGPAVDDREERHAAPRDEVGRIGDSEDTTATDGPKRFVEIARSEGFFVAATFQSVTEADGAETLWVLTDPYAGLLATVVGTDTEVLDALLHCNLHTDETGLRRVPFQEHRDPASQTIYFRETCAEQFRAKCRRLRATNALVREWKVSPTIFLLTPGEWQSAAVALDDPREEVDVIHALNRKRIDALPEPVRRQFRFSEAPDEPG